MKFTLLFDGPLKANGSPTKKQEIRDSLHPQLYDLWGRHPAIKSLCSRRYVELNSGFMYWEQHHSMADPPPETPKDERPHIDLVEPVNKAGQLFVPLVRERIGLNCSLKIAFLRNEPPGKVYQGGDIDNRLKTLLDALSVPQHDEQVVVCKNLHTYCLLENDALITGLDVQTHRLLAGPQATPHQVHLLIEVDVRVTNPRLYNQMFLGD